MKSDESYSKSMYKYHEEFSFDLYFKNSFHKSMKNGSNQQSNIYNCVNS